jgi:hypothetical protein
MPIRTHAIKCLLIATVLVTPATFVACSPRQVYDPYYTDTHRWDHHEEVLYEQWEVETHRDHLDFEHRSETERHTYFDWRHNHHD